MKKPSLLDISGVLLFTLGLLWIYTMTVAMSWYVEHIHNRFIIVMIVISAILMVEVGGIITFCRDNS